jgi:hypothetical protein
MRDLENLLRRNIPSHGYSPLGYPNTRIYARMRVVSEHDGLPPVGSAVTYEGEDFGVHYFVDDKGQAWGLHAHQIEVYLAPAENERSWVG